MPINSFDLGWLLNEIQLGVQPKYVFFWGHTGSNTGVIGKQCFSQWYPASFCVDGQVFQTAEHFMMARKAQLFGDVEIYERILVARTPGEAKHLGREVRGFEEKRWKDCCFQVVIQGNLAKFEQNPALRDFLLSTRNRVLVEASPVDRVWGIGLSSDDPHASDPRLWEGPNLLGFALMEVRRKLDEARP
ncbi:NADAR family protein [Dyella amyloliquefaciens]|uniref:NADAR family protein n=1 Tax=Dyella amyloliquefaciens TaxID=1770545 RepID=UPI00102E2BE8|nr:NADAR family protein [Dyella amyloliquefaciens]